MDRNGNTGDGKSSSAKTERQPIDTTSNYGPESNARKLHRMKRFEGVKVNLDRVEGGVRGNQPADNTSDTSPPPPPPPTSPLKSFRARMEERQRGGHGTHTTRRNDRQTRTGSPVSDQRYHMSGALRGSPNGSIQRSPSVSGTSTISSTNSGPVYTGRKAAPGPGHVPRTDTLESSDSQEGGVPITLVDLSHVQNGPKRSSTVGRQFSLSKRQSSTRSERPLSLFLNRNSQIGRRPSARSAVSNNDGSGSDAQRDPSLSTVSSSPTIDGDPQSTRKALVSGWAQKFKGKEASAKEKAEKTERHQRMKEASHFRAVRVKKCLKKASGIALPLIRDTLENTAQYGRMLGQLASYVAPAALMLIFLWDAVQFVDTMKDTLDVLVERAVKQHESLTEAMSTSVELLKTSVRMKQGDPFTTANYEQIASILREHKDVCQSTFDKVLKTKRINYMTKFIRRKQINEIDVLGAKSDLDDALAKVNTTTQLRIYANSMNLLKRMDEVADQMGLQRVEIGTVKEDIGTVRVEIGKMMGEVKSIRGLSRVPKKSGNKASSESDEELGRKELDKLGREELEEFRRAEIREVEKMISAIDEALRDSNAPPIEIEEDETVLNSLTKVKEDIARLEMQKRREGLNGEKAHELEILKLKKAFYGKLLELEKRATRAPTEDKGTQTPSFGEQSPTTRLPNTPSGTMQGPLDGSRRRPRGGEEVSHGRNSDRTATRGTERDRNPMIDVPVSEESPITQENLGNSSESSIYNTYQSQLVRPFDASLRHVLWTPSPVRIGCVGYISKAGEFKVLFEPDKMANKPEFSSLYSSFPRLNNPEGIDKTERVKKAIGQSREPLNRRSSILSRGKPSGITDLQSKIGRRIQAQVILPNVNSSTVAHLVLDKDCKYRRLDEADVKLLKEWFSQHIDHIHGGCKEGVAKEDIILVVGTLFAKNWAMLLATEKIRRQLIFYELEPTKQRNERRRSSSRDISQPWGVYSIQHWRTYKENSHYTTKISQSNPGRGEGKWDTVLFAGIYFTKDSNGNEVCISDYDRHHQPGKKHAK